MEGERNEELKYEFNSGRYRLVVRCDRGHFAEYVVGFMLLAPGCYGVGVKIPVDDSGGIAEQLM